MKPVAHGVHLYLTCAEKLELAGRVVTNDVAKLSFAAEDQGSGGRVPMAAVRSELLEPTHHRTRFPHKGEATYASIRVGDRVAENAVWRFPDPIDGGPPLGDYLAFEWGGVDAWYEEDEEIFVHARDP
jgi:uncharacterized protein (DUF427 family)